jgi:hypothetical protein
MNVAELRSAVAEAGVPPYAYRILEPPDQNTWCLQRVGKTWLVYYVEYGRRDLQRFKDESRACEYFFNQLTQRAG